ncbi:MAG: dockerin type I domain-containing protein, partial [Candidatus Poribacteria bacterium]|nr:dockerin type I domain-containing protein [Candidatus Poribacteria bacterium]
MKKIICPFLILGLTLLCLTTSHAQAANLDALRAADVNADGTINILDMTFIASHFGKSVTSDQMPNPDVTGDGIVNILDLVLVAGQMGKTVRPPVGFVSANPMTESQLEINATITLTFDNIPEDVEVSTGIATIADETVTIAGPFAPGALGLTITWLDGTQTLAYTIRQPARFVSAVPVADTQLEVNGTITLTFDSMPEDVEINTGVVT